MMRRIDELHMQFPFAGSRMLRDLLRQEGYRVGRQHVATLMKKMGIEALYRRLNMSKATPGGEVASYLVRGQGYHQVEPDLGHAHHVYSDGS
ncbi:MAG: IS3 family transposase [Paracoccaceae bacterium]